MSVSRHPVALRLERQVGEGTRLLATVMALPLIDGIFPALVIAGALSSPLGIIETGLLIFGGSATVAVILAEMDGTRREQVVSVLALGALLLPIAGLEALFAETLRSVLSFEVFHRFAGLVILAVAAKTASSKVGEYLPSPGIIIGFGLIASVDLSGAALVVEPNVETVARAVAAAGTGVGFALSVALFGPHLRGAVDLDRFRFGSSVALGMLAIDVLGLLPTQAPVALGVLGVTALFAYDPGAGPAADAVTAGSDGDDGRDVDAPAAPSSAAVADGGDADGDESGGDSVPEGDSGGSDTGLDHPDEGSSRAPWL
ncbi:DUF5794 domain-containing protein [Halobellus sp. GM3]|uniref:DUF5794 domain-containing protein n=1 Tax=Halobellus sp. GM3 TaxID=3458410 RepID=UPI00403E22FB